MPIDFNYSGIQQSLTIGEVTDLQTNLDLKANSASPTFSGTVTGITKAMVGLGVAENTTDLNKVISSATQTALNLKANEEDLESVSVDVGDLQTQLLLKANLASPSFSGTVAGIDKNMVGLGNVDNISDINKVVSNATTTQLNLKQPLLNNSSLFLDTSIANQPKLGLGTATPSSTSGGDTLFQIFGQTDCALSIKRGGGGDWEFKCNNPTGSLSVYNGGSHRAEWTNSEFELKQGLTVKGAVVDMEALPTSAQTGTTKLWNNSGAINIGAGASGGGGSGVNLETICEVMNGQSYTTKNNDTITIQNISAVLQPNQTGSHSIMATISGYVPPTGTKTVLICLKFFIGWNGNLATTNAIFDCRINGEYQAHVVKSTQSFIKTQDGMGSIGSYEINTLINVDSSIATDDIPGGKIKNWTTAGYTFNFCSSRTMQNSLVWLFSNNPHPYNSNTLNFVKPIIQIQAFS